MTKLLSFAWYLPMVQQLLIADADSSISGSYLEYFAAHGYIVRIASGAVECLTALRMAPPPPDVLVLVNELKWGGADGLLAVMEEDNNLSAIPTVLLSDADGMDAVDQVAFLLAINSRRRDTALDASTESTPFLCPPVTERDSTCLSCSD